MHYNTRRFSGRLCKAVRERVSPPRLSSVHLWRDPWESHANKAATVIAPCATAISLDEMLNIYRPRDNKTSTKVLFQVQATDPDCGVNANVRFSLVDHPSTKRIFSIDDATGTICLDAPLDFEQRRRYQLTVIAQDGGECKLRSEMRCACLPMLND